MAATKTYTAQALAVAMLSAALRGGESPGRSSRRCPTSRRGAIDLNAAARVPPSACASTAGCVVVGRGYNLSTAFEITLKVKETTGVMADGYSSADFLHGPKAILDRNLPVLAVAPGPRVFDDLDGLVRADPGERRAAVVISDRPELLEQADVAMPLPADAGVALADRGGDSGPALRAGPEPGARHAARRAARALEGDPHALGA